jgi:acyl dehydratase
MLFFEDMEVGRIFDCGSRQVTKEEIVDFARQFDPQLFHVDESVAARGRYGGLIASGWHSCSIAMRLAVDAFLSQCANMGSPGMEVRFHIPVRPDDTLCVKAIVVDRAPSRRKPDRGRVDFRFKLSNQRGELVAEITSMTIFRRAPKGSAEIGAGQILDTRSNV